MFFRILLLLISISLSFPALAQTIADAPPEASLPIEVALMYQKKQGIKPDFESLAKQSPAYINAPHFAKKVFLHQETENLKNLYNTINDQSTIIVFADLKVGAFDRKMRRERVTENDLGTFSFADFNFDTHYTYDYGDDIYAVFIKNIADFEVLPLQSMTATKLSTAFTYNKPIAAELTLRPSIVDDNFMLYDETPAKLILSDLVDIKLIEYESGKVIYHEIAAEWKPRSRIDKIINDIVQENKF